MNSRQKANRGGNGRWTKTEHQRFLKGLQRYGRDWVSVQKVVKTRSLIQVRSHAQKVFAKMSESEIRSLIGEDYEFESSYVSQVQRSSVTEQENIDQQNNTPSRAEVKPLQNNLLDIFVQALQNEGVSFPSENQSSPEKNDQSKSFLPLSGYKHQKQTQIQISNPQSFLANPQSFLANPQSFLVIAQQ